MSELESRSFGVAFDLPEQLAATVGQRLRQVDPTCSVAIDHRTSRASLIGSWRAVSPWAWQTKPKSGTTWSGVVRVDEDGAESSVEVLVTLEPSANTGAISLTGIDETAVTAAIVVLVPELVGLEFESASNDRQLGRGDRGGKW